MYYRYFGLDQPPFRITPDTRLFFPGGNRGAVLEALVYAIGSGEGIVKVVGEVGSGTTMLCRMLERELQDSVEIVYLANPNLTPDDILKAIAFELKIPLQPGDTRLQVMQRLHELLLHKHGANRRVVAFIEEAQGMPIETLEEIRMLTNLETSVDKLLQIVLFGQPELDATLAGHDIRQLRERITYSFTLEPFAADEIRDYLSSRLRASGARSPDLFTAGAVRGINRYSAGLLRRINILADKALLAAYADNAGRVTAKHVERAAKDSEFALTGGARWRLAAAVAAAVTLSLLGLWLLLATPWRTPGDELAVQAPAPAAVAPAPVETAVVPPAAGTTETTPPVTPAPAAALPAPVGEQTPATIDTAVAAAQYGPATNPVHVPEGLLGLEALEPILAPGVTAPRRPAPVAQP
ncbi:MAG: AAA family ATPase [Gammaproteobacteria bacterium]|nr:AAA family ATPase [Gammaproteobacteria bacterium]